MNNRVFDEIKKSMKNKCQEETLKKTRLTRILNLSENSLKVFQNITKKVLGTLTLHVGIKGRDQKSTDLGIIPYMLL